MPNPTSTTYIQVETTTATQAQAESIAKALVEAKLAACVQIFPCHSLYRWQGKIEQSNELRCTIKSRLDLFPELSRLISELHPYDTPEVVATPIVDGAPTYMGWLEQELKEKETSP